MAIKGIYAHKSFYWDHLFVYVRCGCNAFCIWEDKDGVHFDDSKRLEVEANEEQSGPETAKEYLRLMATRYYGPHCWIFDHARDLINKVVETP